MKKLFVFVLLGGFVLPSISSAIDLKQAKFTQVVSSVDVISTADKSRHAAAVNDTFNMPDMLRTGPNSRAELLSGDDTITRVGANTIFSFDPANRTLDLQQGSLLFHTPHGKGGGTIHTGSATATVLGTTIIVTSTPNGGFKVLVLEGEAEIRFLNGAHLTLTPGQMVFVLPGGGSSPIVVFRLDDETKGSLLVNGFDKKLPSWGNIQSEITRQLLLILNNKLQDTDLVVGDNASPGTVLVVPQSAFNTDSSIIGTDHTPNQTLPVNYPPLDANHVENDHFTPPSIPSFTEGLEFLGIYNPVTGGTPASGFVGHNVDIDTANVDLSSFAGVSDFDIMAANDLRVWQGVDFTGIGQASIGGSGLPDIVSLFAGNQMLIARDSTLEADTGTFALIADSFGVLNTTDGSVDVSGTLQNISIYNFFGDVDVLSLSDLTIEGMNSDYTVYAGGNVDIQSDGSLTIGNPDSISRLDGYYDVLIDAGADVDLTAGGGDLNLNYANIYAGDSGLGTSSYTGGEMNLYADNSIYSYGSDLYAYSGEYGDGDVNVYANSVVDLEYTYIYADGDVNVESGDELYLGWWQDGSEIYARGSVYLASDYADVNIWGYDIYAGYDTDYPSDVEIDSYDGAINIGDTYIEASGNVDMESWDTLTLGYDGYGNEVDAGGNVNLTSDYSDVDIYNYDIYAYGSDVNVNAGYDVDIEGSGIYAVGDVNINSGEDYDISTLSTSSGYGDVYISDSTIKAGYDYDYGGSVNINANNGNFTLSGDTVDAYSGWYGYGDVSIHGYGVGDIEDTYINADGYVGIESSGNLYIGWFDGYYDNNGIYADGSIYLTSDYGDVDIYDYYDIQSYNSDVDINAAGDVNIESSYVYAGEDVNINSGGVYTDSLNSSGLGDVYITDGSEIYAGYDSDYYNSYGSVNITAAGNVSIEDSTIYAADDVNINAEGTINQTSVNNVTGGVDIEDSEIQAGWDAYDNNGSSYDGGSVTINANNGNVYFNDDDIEAYSGEYGYGNVNVYGYGTVDVEDSYIYGDGDVTIDSEDLLTLGNVSGDEIEAGGSIYLQSYNAEVAIYDTDIYAYYGDVNVTAPGNIHIEENTYIDAGGDVNINSGGSYNPGNVNNSSVDIENSYITSGYDYNCGYPSYSGGDVTINANNGDVVMVADEITAYGGYCNNGDVNIFATDNINIDKTTIDADGDVAMLAYNDLIVGPGDDVTIDAEGNISLEGDNYVDVEYTTATADGSVGLYSYGTIYASDSTLTADNGDVTATSWDGGYIDFESLTISAGGNVNLTANYGDVDVNNSTINAGGSADIQAGYDDDFDTVNMNSDTVNLGVNVTIGSPDDININNTDISAGNSYGDINIQNQSIEASSIDYVTAGGNLSISAGNDISIDNSTINLNGNITVDPSTLTSDSGDVTLETGGSTYVSGYDVYFDCSSLTGNNISVTDSYINSNGGNVNIINDASATFDIGNYIDICGSTVSLDNINVDYSTLIAEGGDLNIIGDGNLSVYVGGSANVYDSTLLANNITVDNSEIYATADVNIEITGTISLDSINTTYGGGNIDIGNTEIKAGWDYNADAASISGGNVLISDTDGNVYLHDGDQIYAYSGTGAGIVTINAGGTVDVEGSTISAGDFVSVWAGDSLTLGYYSGDDISAVTYVDLTSEFGDVDIYDTGIYTDAGNVNINAYYGNIDIESSDVNQGNNVYANAWGYVNVYDVNNDSYDGNYGDTYLTDWNIVSYDWDVDISADQDVSIYNSSITAYDNVNIQSGGEIFPAGNNSVSSTGNVDIGNSSITAGWDTINGYSSFDGGDVNITANSGDVTLNEDSIRAYYGDYNNGDVNICASGDVNIEGNSTMSTYINADGNVNVTAGGMVNVNEGDSANDLYAGYLGLFADIYAGYYGGDINLDGACVSVAQSVIYAEGNVIITAEDGNVNLTDAVIQTDYNDIDVSAYYGDVNLGSGDVDFGVYLNAWNDVNIYADYTVNINDSGIYADNDIYINAGGGNQLVSLKSTGSQDKQFSQSYAAFQAPGVIILPANLTISGDTINYYGGDWNNASDPGNVVVSDDTVYVHDGSANISAGGNATVEYSDIYAYGGGITIEATGDGNVFTYDNYLEADNGDVSITALGTDSAVDIEGTEIYSVYDNVNIESANNLSLGYENDFGSQIYAGGGVSLTSDNGNVDIWGYSIYADYEYNSGSDLDITANDGNVYIDGIGDCTLAAYDGNVNIYGWDSAEVYNTYVSASGDVNIESGGTVELSTSGSESVEAGGSINLTSDYFGDVEVYDYSLDAYSGEINLNAYSGNIDVEYSYLEAGGDVNIYAYDSVFLFGDDIYSDTGDINISADADVSVVSIGTTGVNIFGSTVEAYDGGVSISSYYDTILACDHIYGDNGNVTINGDDFVEIEGSTIGASGDVEINSYGTVLIGDYCSNEIDASGNVTIESYDGGDVDVYESTVNANGGTLDIYADFGNVDLEGDTLTAGNDSNVNISSSYAEAYNNVYITATGGTINVGAWNNMTILGTAFDLGGNIDISSSASVNADNGDVDINTYGDLNINWNNSAYFSGDSVSGGNITIDNSTVTANNGTVNITANGNANDWAGWGFDVSGANNISIQNGSSVTAPNGNVNLSAGGNVLVDNSTVSASTSAGAVGISSGGKTTIQDGATVQGFYLNVSADNGILIDGTSGGGVHLSGNSMTLTAYNGSDVNVNNADLGNYATVNMTGHTVTLNGVNFSSGSSYNFTVFNHDFYINSGVNGGAVNFINDTLDHGTSITGSGGENPSNNGGIVLGGTGQGIHVN